MTNSIEIPDFPQELKDRFDYEIVIGFGLHKGRLPADVIRDLSGERFRINLNNRLFIEGIDEFTYRVHTRRDSTDCTYSGEEKTYLQALAAKSVELFLANHEIAALKAKLEAATAQLAEVNADVIKQAGQVTVGKQ